MGSDSPPARVSRVSSKITLIILKLVLGSQYAWNDVGVPKLKQEGKVARVTKKKSQIA